MKPGAPSAQAAALSKMRLRLWLRLLKVSRGIEARLRERLRDGHGSTLPRFDVMAALYRAPGGLKMTGISGALRVSNGNVTGIVDKLVEEGRVERVAVEGDRRATLVRLTPAGRAHFETLAAGHEAWIDGLLGGVDAETAAGLIATLDRIAAELEREGERP
jgi:DNA-binding MarR family transcriptional regulator